MTPRSPVWHPFTQHAVHGEIPTIVRTEGAWLEAADGRRIFDAISSWWVVTHGHRYKPIMDAIQNGIKATGVWATHAMAEGSLKSLLNNGIFAGVGAVVVFVPQIALLFFFLAILTVEPAGPHAADAIAHHVGDLASHVELADSVGIVVLAGGVARALFFGRRALFWFRRSQ